VHRLESDLNTAVSTRLRKGTTPHTMSTKWSGISRGLWLAGSASANTDRNS
jgi:hypothetical protein